MISRRDIFKAFAGLGALVALPATTFAKYNLENEKIISEIKGVLEWASNKQMFEINDNYTRAVARSMIEPFLYNCKGEDKVYDYLVICDETNNTPTVIDRNEFKVSVFLKFKNDPRHYHLDATANSRGIGITDIRLDT